MHQPSAQHTVKAPASGAPFSAHARGVLLLDSVDWLDVPQNVRRATHQLRDISASGITFLLLQSWLTVYNLVITVGSTAFYVYVHTEGEVANLDWTPVSFSIILPTLIWIAWVRVLLDKCSASHPKQAEGSAQVFYRREQALWHLAEVKTLLIHISLASGGSKATQECLFGLIDCFRSYLNKPRFYSTAWPYGGVKYKMLEIAQDRSKVTWRISALIVRLSQSLQENPDRRKQLQEVERSEGGGDRAVALLQQLHTCYERLANIKEYRTPQGLRAMLHIYVVLLIPLFYGPYYAYLHNDSRSFTFVLFLAMVTNLSFVGLLNVALSLEDPFDNFGLDGVFCDEALYEAEQAILMSTGEEGSGGGGVLWGEGVDSSKPAAAPQPPVTFTNRPTYSAANAARMKPLPDGDSLA